MLSISHASTCSAICVEHWRSPQCAGRSCCVASAQSIEPSTLVIQLRNQQHIMAIVVGFNMCGGNGNP